VEVVESEVKGILVVKLSGRLDAASSPLLERKINSSLEGDRLKLLLNFEGVDYLSSAGMRLLLNLTKKLKSKQGRVAIAGVRPDVMEVIKMAGFDHILDIYSDEQGALATFER